MGSDKYPETNLYQSDSRVQRNPTHEISHGYRQPNRKSDGYICLNKARRREFINIIEITQPRLLQNVVVFRERNKTCYISYLSSPDNFKKKFHSV